MAGAGSIAAVGLGVTTAVVGTLIVAGVTGAALSQADLAGTEPLVSTDGGPR